MRGLHATFFIRLVTFFSLLVSARRPVAPDDPELTPLPPRADLLTPQTRSQRSEAVVLDSHSCNVPIMSSLIKVTLQRVGRGKAVGRKDCFANKFLKMTSLMFEHQSGTLFAWEPLLGAPSASVATQHVSRHAAAATHSTAGGLAGRHHRALWAGASFCFLIGCRVHTRACVRGHCTGVRRGFGSVVWDSELWVR